jgi:hypothetical protein
MVFLTPVKQANTGLTDAICRVEPLGSLPIRALALPLRRIARRLQSVRVDLPSGDRMFPAGCGWRAEQYGQF